MVRTVRRYPTYGWMFAAAVGVLAACFTGGDLEDKEPPRGAIGGVCYPDDLCDAGVCLWGEVCYDPNDPCKGFYCGGHGDCFVDLDNDNTPICVCDPGYVNNYALFCEPVAAGG